jgi:hypothetical protein
MDKAFLNRFLADLLLVSHTCFIAFIVLGLILIVMGALCRWSWTRNFWFRLIHLLAIGFVVTETWLEAICPLTIWENDLREAIGSAIYSDTFVKHWLHKLIFYDFPDWVFTLSYTIFGALVLISWIGLPPKFPWNK